MGRLLKHRRLLLSAAAIIALLAVALWPAAVPVEVATVSRGPLLVTVDEEGRTRVRDRFVVSAPVTGRMLRVGLEPGTRVRQGDVIAHMAPEMPPLLDPRTRAEAQAAVAAARAALGRARAEEERARAALMQAERELARSRGLAESGAIPAREVERQETDARVAREALQAATFAASAAAAELERAEARLAAPAPPAGALVPIRAPADGVILRRLQESERIVAAGEPLLEIGDPANLEVVVDLLSTDAVRVREGARAIVEQLGGELALDATVARVEPSAFTKVSALGVEEQRVNVILALSNGTAEDFPLGDGYRVEVRIVVWEAPNVVKVPTSALFRDGERWAVYEVREGRAYRTLVEIGRQTGREAQVVSGLSEGAQVVVHPGDRIADGTRVEMQAG